MSRFRARARKLWSPIGVIGSLISSISLGKFLQVGGDLDFLRTTATSLWSLLDTGKAQLFGFLIGSGLIVWALFRPDESTATTSSTRATPSLLRSKQESAVKIDVIGGIVADVRDELRVLLHIKVFNRSVEELKAQNWFLELSHEGKTWKHGHRNPIPRDLSFQVLKSRSRVHIGAIGSPTIGPVPVPIMKRIDEYLEKVSLDQLTATDGWIMFHVVHAMMEHVFASTFTVKLISTDDKEYTGIRSPGIWLTPATLTGTNL